MAKLVTHDSMNFKRERLNQFSVDIEFLLISVVQGAALATLATNSIEPLSNLQFQYWPYIFAGFFIILIFWSQAVIHTISFIDWPINMIHNFFYFLTGFFEILAFSHITSPVLWYGFLIGFFVVSAILYIIDFYLIASHKNRFTTTPAQKLYAHIIKRQKLELYLLMPAGLIFNILAFTAAQTGIDLNLPIPTLPVLACLQAIISLAVLGDIVLSFQKRVQLISECITE